MKECSACGASINDDVMVCPNCGSPLTGQEPPVQQPVQARNEPRITGVFRVTGTKQQIIALRDFMRENQIKFEIVKEK